MPRRPLPSVQLWMGGSLAWALAMAASFQLSVHLFGRATSSHDLALTLIYAAGGLLGWLIALPLIHLVEKRGGPQTALAAWLLLLGVVTVGAISGIYALQYRSFYAHWHAPFPSRIWVYQQIFTTASALYQFAVLGLRHLLPAGLAMLLVLSMVMARRSR
ncbi:MULTISPECIES: hypothetical protein [Rhizobium/Agrobacterium group]|uniref:hypothetical protein n=1 Tax=Rhizobium/Agrobacterium group TaxID=227290 RepID=UPI0006B9250F|nr:MULTISPECIES: hypothetical protein [Rhizobium/Agrobacterium group]AOG10681.1 putative membrane protein [Agrobacterium sp. RAC06]KPF58080.1 hypothetical protein IP85_11080 [Rhizobium sp. AAP116]